MEEMYKSANNFLIKMQGVDGQLTDDLQTLKDDLKPFAPAPVSMTQGLPFGPHSLDAPAGSPSGGGSRYGGPYSHDPNTRMMSGKDGCVQLFKEAMKIQCEERPKFLATPFTLQFK